MELQNLNSKKLLKELKSCFNSEEIESLAKNTKFIQRSTSKLKGLSFLMLNVFDVSSAQERSLNDSCDWLEEHFGIEMTKQSLDERYNTDAVRFIKACFTKILQKINKDIHVDELPKPFSQIKLVDSTSFKIPYNLSSFYKGYKGRGGASVIKMHLNYDFLSGKVADIFLTDGVAHDNKYKLASTETILPKSLHIRDLGYYDLKQFTKLTKEGAYFLSRAKTDAVYSIKDKFGKFRRIDITEYLPQLEQRAEVKDIYLGNAKNRIKVRLILESVPKSVVEKRLQNLKRYASKHKESKISEQRIAMSHFNVFITNVESQKLPVEMVRPLYTIRWQIELLFKIWKSIFKIDKVKKMSIFRFECYIYSKLIAILLSLHIHNKLGQFLWDEYEFELSPLKTVKLIKKK